MKKTIQKLTIPLGVILLVGLVFASGAFFEKHQSSITDAPIFGETPTTKAYTNHQLDFSLQYPAMFDEVEELENAVAFRLKNAEDLSGFSVITDKTSYTTTKEWLDAQAEGGASTAGYQPVFWIDGSPTGKAVVAQYMVVDRDGTKPIYGKQLSMVFVQNGMVYWVMYANQFAATEIPSVGSEMLGVMRSFQAFIE